MATVGRETQTALVLALLKRDGRVSARDLLLRHGIARAAARIWELRRDGHAIETEPPRVLEDGSRSMAVYRLVDVEAQQAALPW